MSPESVVHIIDDDDAARDSLEFLLKSAGFNVCSYDSPLSFLDRLPADAHGCVVTDVRMPGMTGLELLARLQEMSFPLAVVVITGHGDIPLAVETMKLGASDFLEKPFSEEAILTAVRNAFGADAAADGRDAEADGIQKRLASLSQREKQVLDGVVEGQSNKVIAFNLGISPRTVEIYRANVMGKMRANSLSELVRMTVARTAASPRQAP